KGEATVERIASRYSRNAAPIGRRAEELVHRYLSVNAASLGATWIRWVAQEGVTPGWDLEYRDERGELVAVEVKGTTGSQFAAIELTAGEWRAAQALGEHYWLYLVSECCSTSPKIQRLQNPAALVESGAAVAQPLVWRFAALAVE